jgi:hypothetical protein
MEPTTNYELVSVPCYPNKVGEPQLTFSMPFSKFSVHRVAKVCVCLLSRLVTQAIVRKTLKLWQMTGVPAWWNSSIIILNCTSVNSPA